jgi:hypothetical protein
MRLVANVVWHGVDLAALFPQSAIKDRAGYLWAYGLDRGE